MKKIQIHQNAIAQLCKKYNVEKLYVFGSILTEKFNDSSDIDFIVKFHQLDLSKYADNYFDLKFSLEEILKREIDLLEEKSIRNPYFLEAVNHQKQLIYG
ncbi:MAG: nucleotidyltransferase family protein [Cloacibacterium sp.]